MRAFCYCFSRLHHYNHRWTDLAAAYHHHYHRMTYVFQFPSPNARVMFPVPKPQEVAYPIANCPHAYHEDICFPLCPFHPNAIFPPGVYRLLSLPSNCVPSPPFPFPVEFMPSNT